MSIFQLSRQLAKYQQRDGMSHRDVLRLSHPKARTEACSVALRWAVGKPVTEEMLSRAGLEPIMAFEQAKRATDQNEIIRLIRDYRLPRECIPTQWLNQVAVWEALLEEMPITAMVRNLATMTRNGLLAPMSSAIATVQKKLADVDSLRKGRVHPVTILTALRTYAAGRSVRGDNEWKPVSQVIDALDEAFYLAFKAVEPTNKRWLLAVDVSGSMDSGIVAGIPGFTPREAAGAMAMTTVMTEPNYHAVAFTAKGYTNAAVGRGRFMSTHGVGTALSPLTISKRSRLDTVCAEMKRMDMGGTDCALPMLYAAEEKIPVDCFVLFTDDETWAGGIHPCQALRQYRDKMGINAKMIVVAFTATGFTVADPADAGCLDVAGFDANVPAIMADFATN